MKKKDKLSKTTGLKIIQLENWFKKKQEG